MPIPFATSEVVTAAELNELSRAHWRNTNIVAVVNTITETDLLNGTITIDAGAMSTNRCIRLTMFGTTLNTSGATQASPRFKLKLGATTLIDTNTIAAVWTSSALLGSFKLEAHILNMGATNSQRIEFDLDWVNVLVGTGLTATPTVGVGIFGANNADTAKALINNSAAVDTTAAQALAVTVTLPVANASCSWNMTGAVVEIV